MAIDPMLYEKLSGRKGDPMDRLGAVSAQHDARKLERDSAPKGVSGGLAAYWHHSWKYRMIIGLVGGLILLLGLVLGLVLGLRKW
ncbi:MAG: hypothetical protein U0637_04655 [Phycisphaerales bacterium]